MAQAPNIAFHYTTSGTCTWWEPDNILLKGDIATLSDQISDKLIIYPNPVSSELHIRSENNIANVDDKVMLLIVSSLELGVYERQNSHLNIECSVLNIEY